MAATEAVRRDPYIGQKKKQIRDGSGVYIYNNRFFKYEGEWKDGEKHGHGKLSMADGSYYEGQFEHGEIEGHGFRYFSGSGNSYSGQFHMGELHGQGVMRYGNGCVYEGQWQRNVRQGHGVFRCPDNSVYQGYLYNHKRHGEGTQIYSNGDRYIGDWVNGMRQGHGELRQRDGTTYEGQWQNDVYSGQGIMNHSSGMVYEGLWINGIPALMAAKLVIKNQGPLEIIQGQPFNLEVECQDEDGNTIKDMGREIQLIAGYRYTPPSQEDTQDTAKEASSAGLFDVIEDLEESPFQTPFGYSVLPYPLTDQFPFEENDEALLPRNVPSMEGSHSDTPGAKEGDKEETKEVDTAEQGAEAADTTETTTADEGPVTTESQEQTHSGEDPAAGAVSSMEGLVAPPPVSTRRCAQGAVHFENLVLAAAPPMYRPFTTEADPKPPKSSRKRHEEEPSRPATRGKSREKTSLGDERFARAVSRGKSRVGRESVTAGERKHKQKRAAESVVAVAEGSAGDSEEEQEEEEEEARGSQHAGRAGEYVIMAQDVTNPSFLGLTLEPAFILVKLTIPKKQKIKKQKDKGPKWDTSKHIATSMARGYTDLATEEQQSLQTA